MNRPVIAITMGDAAGVGPEVVVKALAHPDVYVTLRPLVVGDAARLDGPPRSAASSSTYAGSSGRPTRPTTPGTVDCIDLGLVPDDLPFGELSPVAGDAAFRYIERAVALRRRRRGRRDLHGAPQQGGAARGRARLPRAHRDPRRSSPARQRSR